MRQILLKDDHTWIEVGATFVSTTDALVSACQQAGATFNIAPGNYVWPRSIDMARDVHMIGTASFSLTTGFAKLNSGCVVDGMTFTYPDGNALSDEIFTIPAGISNVALKNLKTPLCGNFIHALAGGISSLEVSSVQAKCVAYFSWLEDVSDVAFNDIIVDGAQLTGGQNLIRCYRTKKLRILRAKMSQAPKSCVKLGGVDDADIQGEFSGVYVANGVGPNTNDDRASRVTNVRIHDSTFTNDGIVVNGGTDGVEIFKNTFRNIGQSAITISTASIIRIDASTIAAADLEKIAVPLGAHGGTIRTVGTLHELTVSPSQYADCLKALKNVVSSEYVHPAWKIGSVNIHDNDAQLTDLWADVVRIESPCASLRLAKNKWAAKGQGSKCINILDGVPDFDWTCEDQFDGVQFSRGERRFTEQEFRSLPNVK